MLDYELMIDFFIKLSLILDIVAMSISVLDDYIFLKLFLRKSPLRKAKIIDFKHYSSYRTENDFTVAEYEDENGATNKVFVRRKKSDKIGDVITVVSKNDITVRPEIYKKMDVKMGSYIMGIIFMVGAILYLKSEFAMSMTLQEVLIYLLILLVVFWGTIGLLYASHQITVHDHFKS